MSFESSHWAEESKLLITACKIWPCPPLQCLFHMFSPSLPTYSKFHLIYSKESNFFLPMCFYTWFPLFPWGCQVALVVRYLPVNADVRDTGLIPGFKIPWRRAWQHTPVLLLENPMDRGAWWATVHRVTESRTRLSDLAHTQFMVLLLLIIVCTTLNSAVKKQIKLFKCFLPSEVQKFTQEAELTHLPFSRF